MEAFDKVIGYEGIKKELRQICDMMSNRENYEKVGAVLPSGLLLYGDPGLGKTLMAKCFTEECHMTTFVIRKTSGSEAFIEEITRVFNEAIEAAPSVVLLDDLDKYANEDEMHRDAEEYVAIQAGIDSVKGTEVFVIATANDITKLPDSLIRAGRFDRKIDVHSPSEKESEEIIRYYLSQKNVSEDVNYDDLNKMMSYVSCAQLESILNEAAIEAAFHKKECIHMEDLIKAVLRQEYGNPDNLTTVSEEEIKIAALHEAGHVVACEVLCEGSVGLASIRTDGISSVDGFVHRCKAINRRPHAIIESLAGKAAVEMYYADRKASGCNSDLSNASRYIRSGLVDNANLGFDLMNVSYRSSGISDSTNERIEAVVYAELDRYMLKTRELLLKNKDFLERVAEELATKKNILFSDIQRIREEGTIERVSV